MESEYSHPSLLFAAFLSPGVRKVIMFALLSILAAVGLVGAVSTVVVTARDGYRRVPTRQA